MTRSAARKDSAAKAESQRKLEMPALMTVKELRSKKGKVALCALTPYVKEIFDVSNFSSIIPITDTVETGLQQMR